MDQTLTMDTKKESKLAYRATFWSLAGALIVAMGIAILLPPGDDRNMFRSIGVNFGVAAIVVMIAHRLKPQWFRSKVRHHPDENIKN
jgi:hypothetical protein